jgi:hypothetical protein
MKSACVLAVLAMLLAAFAGAADDAKLTNDRDPWNGFGVGSWVIVADSLTKMGETETRREKQTRTRANEPRIELTVREEGKTPGVFDGRETIRINVAAYDPALDPKCKVLETRKEELIIEGKKYACEVKKYDLSEVEMKATATFWRCPDVSVPYREAGVEPRTLAVHPGRFAPGCLLPEQGSAEKKLHSHRELA